MTKNKEKEVGNHLKKLCRLKKQTTLFKPIFPY